MAGPKATKANTNIIRIILKKPFCDGSHKKLNAQLKEDEDKYEPHRFICEESRSVLLCMCKSSSNRPFCDLTHSHIQKKSKRLDIFKET